MKSTWYLDGSNDPGLYKNRPVIAALGRLMRKGSGGRSKKKGDLDVNTQKGRTCEQSQRLEPCHPPGQKVPGSHL